MKRAFEVFLGVLTAFGGFVDMGDLVANAETGARFGMRLAWVVVLGVIGIVIYAEMAGRVASVSGRPVFDVVRERLGARAALVNLVASAFINLLTLTAEIAGLAVIVELVTGIDYLLWLPLAAVAVWLVIWKVKFSVIEKAFGLTGLLITVVAVALWRLGPDWGALVRDAVPSVPAGESFAAYAFFAIALLGAAMTPYEVFFFSSGAVEDGWTRRDLHLNRANVYLGFPLGGLLSLAIMASTAVVLRPLGVAADTLGHVTLPVGIGLGTGAVAILLIGMFAAIFSAGIETALSAGYTVSQFFGWQWGKYVRPKEASLFHLVVIASIVLALGIGFTTLDPVEVTEYSIVLSAAALPLTYFPILIVANDPTYVAEATNSKVLNAVAFVYLVILVVVALATIPLMIVSKGGA
ncbi:MAG TPA: divalent metal cation transporter [Actinomycetota bacterium]|nr:divalent metal cation transporter [Actinomycetota bacterium]